MRFRLFFCTTLCPCLSLRALIHSFPLAQRPVHTCPSLRTPSPSLNAQCTPCLPTPSAPPAPMPASVHPHPLIPPHSLRTAPITQLMADGRLRVVNILEGHLEGR